MPIVIDKSSPEGNAFHVIAYVSKFLNKAGRQNEWPSIQEEMMSGDYENLCEIAERVTSGAVQVVDGEGDNEDDYEEDEEVIL